MSIVHYWIQVSIKVLQSRISITELLAPQPARPWRSPGEQGWKILSAGHCFFSIFDNSRKTNGRAFSGQTALRLYTSYNHCPCARPAHEAESGPWPNSKCSNSVEVECSFLRLKLCQRRRRDRHWRNSRKTNYKELSNTKARVSVHWRAKSHAEWPRGGKEFQHPARIKPVSLYGTRLTATRVNH